jgi:hypothetical protein
VTTIPEDAFAQLAIEQWKLVRLLERLIPNLPEEMRARVAAQARFAGRQLGGITASCDVLLTTFEEQAFEPSLPLVAVNAEDFIPGKPLIVSDTLEPAVVRDGRIVQMGKVALASTVDHAHRD